MGDSLLPMPPPPHLPIGKGVLLEVLKLLVLFHTVVGEEACQGLFGTVTLFSPETSIGFAAQCGG